VTARHLLSDVRTNANGTPAVDFYLGGYPDQRLLGTVDMVPVNPDMPHERTADGCPGGWYRSSFVDSIVPYLRRRTEGGGRVQNPRFDSASWQIQEAALHVEHEQERRQGWISEERFKRSERELEAEARRRKLGRR
jgi:hypothetical protein